MSATAAIVICAYNDAEYIGRVVCGAVQQDLPGREIIVVDDCSTDGTGQVLEDIPDIKVIRNEKNMGLAATLTRGVAATDASIVISLHSDCLLRDSGWLARMVQLFDEPNVGAVVSRRVYSDRSSLPIGARLFDTVCPQQLNPKNRRLHEIDFFRGKADAYRREVIDKLGGWDRAFFTAGEDTDLSIKMRAAGYRILLHPDAAIEYIFSSRQKTIAGGFQKAILYGKTAALLYRRHQYDGLQTRSYLWCLFGIIGFLLPTVVSLLFSAVLFVTSFNRCFVFHRLRRQMPLGILYAGFLLLFGFSAIASHTPPLPVIALAVPAGSAFFTGFISMKNSLRALRDGESLLLMPLLFCYSFFWHLVTGVGYLEGYLRLIWGGRR